MITSYLEILSIFGLSFLIKESDIFSLPRNYLMRKSVFVYKMLECYACTSTHSGYIVYCILTPLSQFSIRNMIVWALAGTAIGLLGNGVINKLYRENNNEI